MRVYRRLVVVTSVAIAVLGVVMLIVTAAGGGGSTGFVVGGLFVALGVARLTLERKRDRL
jgi:hypothetical protein